MVKYAKRYFFFLLIGLISFWRAKPMLAWPDLPKLNLDGICSSDSAVVEGDYLMSEDYGL